MCMDAGHGDLDGDGDLDLALAQEFALNLILLNDGAGVFTVADNAVMAGSGDNEDLGLADFDADGDIDMISVHEDDAVHALLLNDGSGTFSDASSRIPFMSVANAVEVIDLDGNGRLDILLGNAGANLTLLQATDGSFTDETPTRPIGAETTQDLLLVDIDGDGDQDLYVANETDDRLFINDGTGVLTDESAARLPGSDGETRQVDAADIDGDGDLDLVLGNVDFLRGLPVENRLLVNDGNGIFTDVTDTQLAALGNSGSSFTIHFFDIDADGDPDILSPVNELGAGGRLEVWINDGTGTFGPNTLTVFDASPDGSVFDIEVFDANGDGQDDLYFCHRTGTDQLYLGN